MSADTETPSGTGPRRVVAWDLPTRLFHWALVACIAVSWVSIETDRTDLHVQAGYVALGLIVFRILWGIVGSRTARFADFVRWPGAALAYLRDTFAGRARRSLGHNPAGGWSVVLLLGLVGTQATLGLFANDDIFTEGPLAKYVSGATSDLATDIHETLFNVLLAFIALHVAVVIAYRLKGENLIAPMITGRKTWDPQKDGEARQRLAPLWLAAAAAGCAAALVWYVVTQL